MTKQVIEQAQYRLYMKINKGRDAKMYGYPGEIFMGSDNDFKKIPKDEYIFLVNNKYVRKVRNKEYDEHIISSKDWWDVNYEYIWLITKWGKKFAEEYSDD